MAENFVRIKRNQRHIARAYYHETTSKKAPPPEKKQVWIYITLLVLLAAALIIGFFVIPKIQTMNLSTAGQSALTLFRNKPENDQTNTNNGPVIQTTAADNHTIPLMGQAETAGTTPAGNETESPMQGATDDEDLSVLPFPAALSFCIVVNKTRKNLLLFKQNGNEWNMIKHYDVAVGEQEGQKVSEGDKRTPEGQYFIIGKKDKTDLDLKYGPIAYVLNYPNRNDQLYHRSGQGIWIHGTSPDSRPDKTSGCIAMNNGDLSELNVFLDIGVGTPVTIIDRNRTENPLDAVDFGSIQQERKHIVYTYAGKVRLYSQFLDEWAHAWESKGIDIYAQYYKTDLFVGDGMRWPLWRERKVNTFKSYNNIQITLSNMQVCEFTDTSAVVKFLQKYDSDKINVVNGKQLILVLDNNTWKINSERTFPKEELML